MQSLKKLVLNMIEDVAIDFHVRIVNFFIFLEKLRFVFGFKFVKPNRPSLLEVVSFTEKNTTIVSSYLSERGVGQSILCNTKFCTDCVWS